MSVEDRLRRGLAAQADAIEVPVELQLARVTQTTAQRGRRRWAVRALVAAAAVTLLATASVLALDRRHDPDATVLDTPATGERVRLDGEYVVRIRSTPEADQLDLVGRWTVTIHLDGRLDLVPPPGQVAGISGASLRPSGDDLVETNALHGLPGCQAGSGTGRYLWLLDGEALDFTAVGDDCAARLLLFGASTWRRVR